jgi:glucan biosynthesis protein C
MEHFLAFISELKGDRISTSSENKGDSKVQEPVRTKSKSYFFFIDNLRIVLITLVVLHHLSITYGHSGGWYYYEGKPDELTTILFTIFNIINQAFFMGFFFMISGYFTPGSYERKGARLFLKDRLYRLGIPLLFFLMIIAPLLRYVLAINVSHYEGSLWQFLAQYFESRYIKNFNLDTGPLWFVEALLIFAFIYALFKQWKNHRDSATHQPPKKVPSNILIAVFAIFLGIVSFIVRMWFPIGWNFDPLNFQIAFFPQYVVLFILGLVAYHRNWFTAISDSTGKFWGKIAIALIILLPVMMLLLGGAEDPTPFLGGVHWQALIYAVWEQAFCIAVVITLLVLFRKRFNYQGRLAKRMSASAYTVFLIHAPVAVLIALAFKNISLHPLIKFPIVGLIVVALCFLLGNFIRKLPITRNIL